MKKKDLILGAGIIVIALAMLLVMQLTRGEEGNQIRVTLDGKIYGTYSLSKDQTIEVKDGDFYNRIRIEDGKAAGEVLLMLSMKQNPHGRRNIWN